MKKIILCLSIALGLIGVYGFMTNQSDVANAQERTMVQASHILVNSADEANKLKADASLIVKEGKAEMGDTVVIDFKGTVDGVAFDGGEAENYELELGSHSFIEGFEEQ